MHLYRHFYGLVQFFCVCLLGLDASNKIEADADQS